MLKRYSGNPLIIPNNTGGNVVVGYQKLCKWTPLLLELPDTSTGSQRASETVTVSDFDIYFNVCRLIS